MPKKSSNPKVTDEIAKPEEPVKQKKTKSKDVESDVEDVNKDLALVKSNSMKANEPAPEAENIVEQKDTKKKVKVEKKKETVAEVVETKTTKKKADKKETVDPVVEVVETKTTKKKADKKETVEPVVEVVETKTTKKKTDKKETVEPDVEVVETKTTKKKTDKKETVESVEETKTSKKKPDVTVKSNTDDVALLDEKKKLWAQLSARHSEVTEEREKLNVQIKEVVASLSELMSKVHKSTDVGFTLENAPKLPKESGNLFTKITKPMDSDSDSDTTDSDEDDSPKAELKSSKSKKKVVKTLQKSTLGAVSSMKLNESDSDDDSD
jgi:hypothetical protein